MSENLWTLEKNLVENFFKFYWLHIDWLCNHEAIAAYGMLVRFSFESRFGYGFIEFKTYWHKSPLCQSVLRAIITSLLSKFVLCFYH